MAACLHRLEYKACLPAAGCVQEPDLGMRVILAHGDEVRGCQPKAQQPAAPPPLHNGGVHVCLATYSLPPAWQHVRCACTHLQVVADSQEGGLAAACKKYKEWVQATYPGA